MTGYPGLLQVGTEVLRGLDADGVAEDACGQIEDETAVVSQGDGVMADSKPLRTRAAAGPSFHLKGEHPGEVSHLLRRHLELGVQREAWVNDPGHLRVLLQETRDLFRSFRVSPHPQRQSHQPAHDQPGSER